MLFRWLTDSAVLDIILSTVSVGFGGGIALLYAFQTRLVYVPNFPPESRRVVWTPSSCGFPADFDEPIEITCADGTVLRGFHIKAMPSLIGKERAKWQGCLSGPMTFPTLIYFQGNAGNIGHRLPLLIDMWERVEGRLNILIVSYRGYGHSNGMPSEEGIRKDASAILEFAQTTNGIDSKIIVFGQSIGGAVAFDLVSRHADEIYAIIVENTFLSIPKLIPSVFPAWFAPLAIPLCTQRWDSEAKILAASTVLPHVLFLAGENDRLVPPSHMRQLHRLAAENVNRDDRNASIVFKSMKGDHVNTCLNPEYWPTVIDFLKAI